MTELPLAHPSLPTPGNSRLPPLNARPGWRASAPERPSRRTAPPANPTHGPTVSKILAPSWTNLQAEQPQQEVRLQKTEEALLLEKRDQLLCWIEQLEIEIEQ